MNDSIIQIPLEKYMNNLLKEFKTCNQSEIKRKEKNKYIHQASIKGQYIYILLNEKGKKIYIGESGISVTRRLYSDGSGAHNKKSWFGEVDKIMYYRDDNLDWRERLFIESMLVKHFKPIYNLPRRK